MHKTSKSIYAMIMAVLMLLLSGCIDGYDRDKISDDIQNSKANAANKIKDFEDATMNLLAFGDYISPDVIRKFEKKYNCSINYCETDLDGALLQKLESGSYDLVITQDYIIDKLRTDNLITQLNFDNIPNYENIGEQYKNLSFDPDVCPRKAQTSLLTQCASQRTQKIPILPRLSSTLCWSLR